MLPEYIQIDNEECHNRDVLRKSAPRVEFPLSDEDKTVLQQLVEKFKSEAKCAGLAAPQIGYSKQMIIFHVPESVKELRKDVFDEIPPTVLINPQYQPLSDEKTIDWEGCFSVKYIMAEVPRFTQIAYQGYDVSGNKIEKIAKGYLARVIQHEVGHLNGELFIDLITENCRSGPIEAMRALRLKEMKS
jgi:peptide deformylase